MRKERQIKVEYSFKNWCEDNNRQDLLDRWDDELNKVLPSEVSYQSNKKYWFKCPKGIHESELRSIQGFTSGKCHDMKCTKCNSFAQYIIDNFGEEYLNKIWNEDNTLDPWNISYKSNKKAFFNCLNNAEHVYEQNFYRYVNGIGCPYCSHQKIFYKESLGYLYPEAVQLWSDKNDKSPFDYYPQSGKEVWWKCPDNIHEDFKRRIYSMVNSGFSCPQCANIRTGQLLRRDLTGQKFGMLTAICIDEERTKNSHKTYWWCQCDCGNPELKSIVGTCLTSGATSSCGCLEHPSGERNPNWKGGKTPKLILARSNSKYNKWRNEVYKKDWYTCQCCGKSKDIEKQAHHLFNFASNEDLRYDVDNGITFCKDCHYTTVNGSFHNVYGTTNNTPEQLEEYVNNKRKELGINIPFSIEAYKNGEILKPNDVESIKSKSNIDNKE